MAKSIRGFTVVELLIVIVVIAILATITMVVFRNSQAEARDARRRADIANIVKALTVYEARYGPIHTGSGCGSNGNGSGWFNYSNGGTYPLAVADCITNSGIAAQMPRDPSGLTNCSGLTCFAYMKYSCTQNGEIVTYVFAHLETVPQTSTDTDTTCATTVDTNQGINYFVKV